MTPAMQQAVWYWGTTLLLAVLLFYPVNRLIWVTRVRRLERRLGRAATAEERQGQLQSARLITAVIVIAFAFLYNRSLVPSG